MPVARTRILAWRMLLAAGLVYAPTAFSQAQRDTSVATGPIIVTGTVTTGENDIPVRRARVSVQGANGQTVELTNQDGQFQIIIPSGTGGLRLSKSGFAPLQVERRALRTGTHLAVRLARGAAINGIVTDPLGAPAVNVPVRVRRVVEGGGTGGTTQFAAETDDQGEFRVGNLPAGRYSVTPGGRGGGRGTAAIFDLVGGARVDELRTLAQGLDQNDLRAVVDSLGIQVDGGRGRGGTGGRGGRGGDTANAPPNQAAAQQGPPPGQGPPAQGRGGRGRGGRGADAAPRDDAASNLPTIDVVEGQEASVSLTIDDQGAAALEQALRLAALAASQRTTSAAAQTGGEVRGRVVSAESRPIRGATVALTPVGGSGSRRTAVTDDAGRYEMLGVPAGSYRARVTKAGMPEVEFGQRRTLQPGRVISIAEKQRVQGIDFSIPKASAIVGTLTDAFGDPFEGASLQVWESTFVDGRTTLTNVSGVRARRTDDRGRYRVYGLLPGTYYVVATEESRGGRGPDEETGARVFYPGTLTATSAAPVMIDAGQDAHGVDFPLAATRAARITGIATSASNGQPARGRALLGVSQRSGEPMLPVQSTRVEEDGSFLFEGVGAGEYVVQVVTSTTPFGGGRGERGGERGRGGAPNAGGGGRGGNAQGNGGGRGGGNATQGRGATPGGTAGGAAPAPAPAQTGGAGRQGTVGRQGTAAAQPQGGAAGQRGGGGGNQTAGGRGGQTGNANNNGARGRGQGTAARAAQRVEREFGMTYVTVSDGETASVRLETAPGAPVSGQIFLEGDAVGVAPSSFGLSAFATNGDTAPLSGSRQSRAEVRDDWTFLFTDLIGENRFVMTRAPDGWWLKSVSVNGVNALEQPVSFNTNGQAVVNVTATFANGTASIEGRVVDDRRQAASDFAVVVFSTDPDRWFNRSPYLKFASPTQDGSFSVPGLPPAEYMIAALDRIDGGPDFGDWQNPAVLNALVPNARRLKVSAGEVATTELRLLRAVR